MEPEKTVFEMVGGDAAFRSLVDSFYQFVSEDEELRQMFPADLEPGKQWQFLFLTQFFGGPARYSEMRGHPRLRMRHNPFPIDQDARDRWFAHMCRAIDVAGITEPARSIMRDYFERGSTFMINAESGATNLMHWQPEKKDDP